MSWPQQILETERQSYFDFFGQTFDLSEFEKTLKTYGQEEVTEWRKMLLEPHFLPLVIMSRDIDFPGWKVKPNQWFYERAGDCQILRNINGVIGLDKEPYALGGSTVLLDTRLKPRYKKVNSQWWDGDILGPIIEDLRKQEKIKDFNPQPSRFNVSADEWEKVIKPVLAQKLGLKQEQVRLERAIEANVIPQLFPHMPRKDDGQTDTAVWYEEYFGNGYRLDGGNSTFGGLADVNYGCSDGRWYAKSIRPLGVLEEDKKKI